MSRSYEIARAELECLSRIQAFGSFIQSTLVIADTLGTLLCRPSLQLQESVIARCVKKVPLTYVYV